MCLFAGLVILDTKPYFRDWLCFTYTHSKLSAAEKLPANLCWAVTAGQSSNP